MIRFIDLFCGIGGVRLGLQQACEDHNLSYECVLSSDIKKTAIAVYERNHGDRVSGNIREVMASDIPDFDILLGGFPCQAFSTAGKRLGFDDTRGTLFFEVARIIKEKQPRAFILENVEGLVHHNKTNKKDAIGDTFGAILNVLDQLDYSVEWKVLNSHDFGVAQNRKRLYIVGIRGRDVDVSSMMEFQAIPHTTFGHVREYGLPTINSPFLQNLLSYESVHTLQGKSIKDRRGGDNNIHSWDLGVKGAVTAQQKTLLDTFVRKRRNKKWAEDLSTAWFDGIPLTADQIKTFINYRDIDDDLAELTSLGYIRLEHPKDYEVLDGKKTKVTRKDLPKGYTLTTGKLSFPISQILSDTLPTPTIVATDAIKLGVTETTGIRTLTDIELKRLFGFPDNYDVSLISNNDVFDVFGNSVTVPVIRELANNVLTTLHKQTL